ncbi:GIY-YIG nuclease family protein [Brevundimonas sp. GW460-12-10-14-LB2]|uniref:GIY-YIG nuclease family protein n=1 Tax=Brevundimonas sp. GW460-12-10-14-LB2 TaxID=1827469 RepID=UPI0018D3838A
MKIGIAWDVKRRLHQLRAGCPDGLRLAGKIAIPSLLALQTEKKVHTALASHAIGREWFRTSPKEARATAAPICKIAHQAADALDQARHDLRYLVAA